jgi:hypothetical protein
MAGSGVYGYAVLTGVTRGAAAGGLRLAPGGKVRVSAVGPDRAPVEGAFARVKTVNGVPFSVPTMGSARTAADGTLEIDAPAGAVEIEARKDALRGTAAVTVAPGSTAAVQVTLGADPPRPVP